MSQRKGTFYENKDPMEFRSDSEEFDTQVSNGLIKKDVRNSERALLLYDNISTYVAKLQCLMS